MFGKSARLKESSAVCPIDHRQGRPYQMMHKGRDIFDAWMLDLLSAYETNHPEPIAVSNIPRLGAAVETIDTRLQKLNDSGIQRRILEPEFKWLKEYTSIDGFPIGHPKYSTKDDSKRRKIKCHVGD